jgi:hypothetical protein
MLLQTKQSFITNLGGHLDVTDLGRELQVGGTQVQRLVVDFSG